MDFDDTPEEAAWRGRVRDHSDGEPEIIEIGPVVGCHAGPGTIGLSFYLP